MFLVFAFKREFIDFHAIVFPEFGKGKKVSWVRASELLKLGQLMAEKSEDRRSGASGFEGKEGNERSWVEIVHGPPRVQQWYSYKLSEKDVKRL